MLCCLQKACHTTDTNSAKLVTITEPHSPSPSFSRTREPIHPRPPSASLAKVLTAVSIYKRRDNVPITVILANAGNHSSAYAECFVSKSPYNDKHLQTKRQRPTITVILANAGTHSFASAECFVSKSPYSGKHLQTKRQRPPMPSFSRTREPIHPRPPSASLAKVLTTTNIYKRRDNVPPSLSFSRTREPIYPCKPRVSLAKILTAASIYKRRDNVPHHCHSRERGNPFIRVRRVLR